MEIPHEELSSDVLKGIIEEFITREGTDYGEEFSIDEKIEQVKALLFKGRAVIVFDAISETCGIVSKS